VIENITPIAGQIRHRLAFAGVDLVCELEPGRLMKLIRLMLGPSPRIVGCHGIELVSIHFPSFTGQSALPRSLFPELRQLNPTPTTEDPHVHGHRANAQRSPTPSPGSRDESTNNVIELDRGRRDSLPGVVIHEHHQAA
jgi:hypothetical protein